ncbi:non-specific serine/threonine protein kinase [Micromonospora saelicesensis]|uniref:Non-specific serine/threonine protein kinase n=1 Tax=Micromonospora saelicesensis TaxID=285676 RepID=A0A1C5AF91_9ACTN|nr:DEAD/DEAH box helicase [Micromonospora saelicesensis]SCF43880.1 non-specific serine/threonine protein kinase [Micromonospora saelicesensis]
MLVIHGLWLPGGSSTGGLAVWAEDSAAPIPAARSGRPARERPHPFAAGHTDLAAVLADAAEPTRPDTALLTLPTLAGAPTDSPELIRTTVAPASRGRLTVAGWRVPTLVYAPDDALSLLQALDDIPAVAGATLRHLAELADFAADLVTRGRVLPGVRTTTADQTSGAGTTAADQTPGAGATGASGAAEQVPAQAVWRPLLTGTDAAWARSLALALPPAARAAVLPPAIAALPAPTAVLASTAAAAQGPAGSAPTSAAATVGSGGPELTAAAVVADALDALTDAAARAALATTTLARGLRPGGPAPAWLAALAGPQRDFTIDPAGLATLSAELDAWQRDAAGGPVRASFRLVEPAPDEVTEPILATRAVPADGAPVPVPADGAPAPVPADSAPVSIGAGRWRLEFGLQAADEPGLHVDAGDIWRAPQTLGGLAGRTSSPQETLLAELGRASRLWPDLDAALRTAAPEAMELDVEGAHRFLSAGAPVLHAAGFGVLLPSWWQRPSARLGARLRARSRTAPGTVGGADAGVGLDALVDYRWEIALGDQPLSAEELAALAETKTPLVRLRGRWVELDPGRLAAGLRLLRSAGKLTVADLLRLGLADGEATGELPVLEVSADGALGDLLAGAVERRLTPLDPPPGFRGTLRPYQQRGLAWLAFLRSLGLGGVLADDMGLGKTVQLLALLAGDAPEAGPTLLVCPMSLVGNWQREAARFTPELRVHVHHGAERARGAEFTAAAHGADLVLTTYSVAARDAADLAGIDWHRVVVDEAQAIKNASTRQAEAVRALPARQRVAVTGTPVENRLADLWSIMQFANPGLLGPAATFRKRFAEPIERHGDAEAAERLRRITGPFVLRRLKTDSSIISDLPEKLEMEVLCNLTAEQAALYRVVVDDMLARIETSDGIERRGLVLATMTRLKQVCNHPAQLLRDGSPLEGRSGKLARLTEILEEVLAAGERALLFTQYAEFGAMLRGHLSARFGREVLFLHGGLGKAERDALVQRFQSAEGPPLFVLSLKAGGTGLTLTAANHVVHVDRWWNPAVEDQATDRAFRIGQRRRVQVRKFVCAGTVEEKVAALIADKRSLAQRVVGTGEQWITELSTGQLRDLFALEAGAVVE